MITHINNPQGGRKVHRNVIILTPDEYMLNIGKTVVKISGSLASQPKAFKSGRKVNTVKDVIVHPILFVSAYIFIEDDSYVECRRCYVYEG